ncbi:MAG: hypothetical protein WD883_00860 [Candidatus Colwellbacteria bacterium]
MERTKNIAKAMEVIADSLVTHLPHTYGNVSKCLSKAGQTKGHHKRCVVEYAEALLRLAKSL